LFDTHPLLSTQLAEKERSALQPGALANDSHVRQVLLAAATRVRNLSAITLVGASALVMLGMGLTGSSIAVFGFGTLLYGSLVGRDALSENFVAQLYSICDDPEDNIDVISEEPDPASPSLRKLEGDLRDAYWGVLIRRSQLQQRINTGPAILQASLPEANRICDTLLAHAQRLVLRGQRLHAYLKSIKLSELADSAAMVELLSAGSTDEIAARTYRKVVRGRERHIETHVEVEGLYSRVLAQLMLIETTLAGSIARLVKITAADDEENSLTASLITQQLEVLVSDVKFLEQSLDELSEEDSMGISSEKRAELR
jgi:hypothetical protein